MATKRLDEEFRFENNTAILDRLNRMLTGIEIRLQGLEALRTTLDEIIDNVTSVGLQRLDEVFTPLVLDAQHRLETFGANFVAGSSSSVAIGLGTKSFSIPSGQREAFITLDFVSARVTGTTDKFMIGPVLAYDRDTGVLQFESQTTSGSGTFGDWRIAGTIPPDLTHAARTDNPHSTTAAQVGAYTTGQTDALLTALDAAKLSRGLNLSDLSNPTAARTNLGLLSAATRAVGLNPTDVPDNQKLGGAAYAAVGSAVGNVPQVGPFGSIDVTSIGVPPSPGGRLTIDAGNPVQTTLLPGAKTTIFYAPHLHKYVPIYDGFVVHMLPIAAPTDANGLPFNMGGAATWAANKNFDLFAVQFAGVVFLGSGPAWQTDTVPGTGAGTPELERFHGFEVNKFIIPVISAHGVDTIPARRATWLGTFRTSANGTTRMDLGSITAPRLLVWNAYHRVPMTADASFGGAGVLYSLNFANTGGNWRLMAGTGNYTIGAVCGRANRSVRRAELSAYFTLSPSGDVGRNYCDYSVFLVQDSQQPGPGFSGLTEQGTLVGAMLSGLVNQHSINTDSSSLLLGRFPQGYHYVQAYELVTGDTVQISTGNQHMRFQMDM